MLRISQRSGSVRVSVFTTPTPLRAGPVDVSVLVQKAESGNVLLAPAVTVRAVCLDEAAHEVSGTATAAHATNKLLQAAVLELDRPGRWRLVVEVEAGERAVVSFDVEVAAGLPSWWPLAPWVGWPAVAIGLFMAHRLLVRRQRIRASRRACPGGGQTSRSDPKQAAGTAALPAERSQPWESTTPPSCAATSESGRRRR